MSIRMVEIIKITRNGKIDSIQLVKNFEIAIISKIMCQESCRFRFQTKSLVEIWNFTLIKVFHTEKESGGKWWLLEVVSDLRKGMKKGLGEYKIAIFALATKIHSREFEIENSFGLGHKNSLDKFRRNLKNQSFVELCFRLGHFQS